MMESRTREAPAAQPVELAAVATPMEELRAASPVLRGARRRAASAAVARTDRPARPVPAGSTEATRHRARGRSPLSGRQWGWRASSRSKEDRTRDHSHAYLRCRPMARQAASRPAAGRSPPEPNRVSWPRAHSAAPFLRASRGTRWTKLIRSARPTERSAWMAKVRQMPRAARSSGAEAGAQAPLTRGCAELAAIPRGFRRVSPPVRSAHPRTAPRRGARGPDGQGGRRRRQPGSRA